VITSISLLGLGGYRLSNQEEPNRFKLENTTVVHRVYIGERNEHRPGCKWKYRKR
jgi:hypothetical protein